MWLVDENIFSGQKAFLTATEFFKHPIFRNRIDYLQNCKINYKTNFLTPWEIMIKLICTLFLVIVGVRQAMAQPTRLSVQINNEWLQPGDTLGFAGTYEKGDKKLPPATLAVVLKQNDGGKKWQMRWPMIDGEAVGAIVIPKGLPAGIYTMYAAVQPRFFRVYGRLIDPPGIKELDLRIAEMAGANATMRVPVEKNGGFMVKDFLFEGPAALVFSTKQRHQLVFSLEAWLDSAYTPVAATAKEIGIGVPAKSAVFKTISADSARAEANRFADPFYSYKELQSNGLSSMQIFDSLYVSPAFKSGVDTVINCMESDNWQKARDMEAFLRTALPGFGRADFEGFPVTAKVNRDKYVLYLDEKPLAHSMMDNLLLADIAMIKVFKPNFMPVRSVGSNNGGIAIYTRRGPLMIENIYNSVRYLNGYQPEIYHLPLNPDE
jgi:hypothetical protein